MNRDNIIKYINHPGKLDQSTLPELEELLNTFPYFQTAYLLHVKNHYNIKSLRFDDSLKSASARIGDRAMLYHLIHGLSTEESHVVELADQEEVNTESRESETLETISGEFKEIKAEVLNEQKEPIPEAHIPLTSDSSLHTFREWLNELDTRGRADHTEVKDAEGADHKQILHDRELIDAFIKAQPKIVPTKSETEVRQDISEAFITPSDHFMTETLAQIYLTQGYYDKAIYAYEKLILKFPEKSSYFASQINKIKQLKDNPNS